MPQPPAHPRFPATPLHGVSIRHVRQNCAPHFAHLTLDLDPAPDGVQVTAVDGLLEDYERPGDVPALLAAAADGVREALQDPEWGLAAVYGVPVAVHVTVRAARADTFGSHPMAFRIAAALAVRDAARTLLGPWPEPAGWS